jgi:hypothetical protein
MDPLPSSAEELLRSEKRREDASRGDVDRAFGRFEVAVAISAGVAAVSASATKAAVVEAVRTKGWLATALVAKPAAVLVGAVLVGGGIGASTYAAVAHQEPARVIYVDRPVAAPPSVSAQPSAIPVPTEAPIESAKALSTNAARASSAPSSPSPVDAADERLLLETARAALGRGDGPGALAALDRHEQKYPHGALGEEREALAVQALVLSGSGPAARARASRFHARYPHSILAGSVDAATATIP